MASLLVRRLELNDLVVRVQWFNTPSVYSQMAVDIPLSLVDTHAWFTRNALADHRRDFCFWLEQDTEAARLVAMAGLTDISRRHQHAELYIVTHPDMIGQGFGTKAVQWLCNYGFTHINLIRIYLYTMPDNGNARRLYERLGFKHEGVLRQHILHHGQIKDRFVHGLLKSEWAFLPWCSVDVPSLEIKV